ncbi:MAG: chemotaxis protein CheW [Candidatus Brocadiaceae bacterium]
MGITKIPNTPPHIEGIVNLRGRLVSVLNFSQKFVEQKEHDEDTRIVIVECGGYPTGIIVDSVGSYQNPGRKGTKTAGRSCHGVRVYNRSGNA